MPRSKTDAKGKEELGSRLVYEKPCLKAVDLHADEIMGGDSCFFEGSCGIIMDPGSTSGPS